MAVTAKYNATVAEMHEQGFLTLTEMAAEWKRDESTVRRMVHEGRLFPDAQRAGIQFFRHRSEYPKLKPGVKPGTTRPALGRQGAWDAAQLALQRKVAAMARECNGLWPKLGRPEGVKSFGWFGTINFGEST